MRAKQWVYLPTLFLFLSAGAAFIYHTTTKPQPKVVQEELNADINLEEIVQKETDSSTTSVEVPDKISLESVTNPVPKPPRGHFVVDDSFVVIEKPEEDTIVSKENSKPTLTLDLVSNTSDQKTPEQEYQEKEYILENSSLVQGVSDSIITTAVAEASTPEKEIQVSFEPSLESTADISIERLQAKPPNLELKDVPVEDMNIKYLQESPSVPDSE